MPTMRTTSASTVSQLNKLISEPFSLHFWPQGPGSRRLRDHEFGTNMMVVHLFRFAVNLVMGVEGGGVWAEVSVGFSSDASMLRSHAHATVVHV